MGKARKTPRKRKHQSIRTPWTEAEVAALRGFVTDAQTIKAGCLAFIAAGSGRGYAACRQCCERFRLKPGAARSLYENMVAMFEEGYGPDEVRDRLGVTPAYARRTYLAVLGGNEEEGALVAAIWPPDAPRFEDVGRKELLQEMLPFSRFNRMPYVELRYSASGCAAALC